MANQTPTANSTAGYRHEIQAPQSRHRPRSTTQLTTGTLSYHRIACPHAMQCERGVTIDSCPGKREMHTFRKLPKSSPNPNPTTSNHIATVTPEVYGIRFSVLLIADS